MSSRPIAVGKMADGSFQPAVLYKLIFFSFMMAVAPIGSYFGSLKYLWNGQTTYAAITAVLAANIVLIGYVVVAFREDIGPPAAAAVQEKKKA